MKCKCGENLKKNPNDQSSIKNFDGSYYCSDCGLTYFTTIDGKIFLTIEDKI